jgi:DNA-directed RNA polymerase subunit L
MQLREECSRGKDAAAGRREKPWEEERKMKIKYGEGTFCKETLEEKCKNASHLFHSLLLSIKCMHASVFTNATTGL